MTQLELRDGQIVENRVKGEHKRYILWFSSASHHSPFFWCGHLQLLLVLRVRRPLPLVVQISINFDSSLVAHFRHELGVVGSISRL